MPTFPATTKAEQAILDFFADQQRPERLETAFRAFPVERVTPRLTTVEAREAWLAANTRAQPGQAAVLAYAHLAGGSPGRNTHAIRFWLADGTTQYFGPHAFT